MSSQSLTYRVVALLTAFAFVGAGATPTLQHLCGMSETPTPCSCSHESEHLGDQDSAGHMHGVEVLSSTDCCDFKYADYWYDAVVGKNPEQVHVGGICAHYDTGQHTIEDVRDQLNRNGIEPTPHLQGNPRYIVFESFQI